MVSGRVRLNPGARADRFRDAKVEKFHPQIGSVSATAAQEILLFAAPFATVIKNVVLTISQTDPPKETPQTQVFIRFKFADDLEIKFPTRDIINGLNSYFIPEALNRLESGTEVYLTIDKTLSVTYSFDIREP